MGDWKIENSQIFHHRESSVTNMRSALFSGKKKATEGDKVPLFTYFWCSIAVKRQRDFSFYLVGFEWKHGQGCIK